MSNTLNLSFTLGAAVGATFFGAFNKAGAAVSELQKRTSSMSKVAGQIENYQKLQSRITTNQAAMLAMSQGARKLSADMKGIPPKATQREIGQLNARAERLQQKLDRDREALSRLRPQLVGAGVDMKNLSGEHARLTSTADRHAKAQERLQKAQARYAAAKEALSWNSIKGEVLSAAGLGLALAVPVKTAANFEQAMARVGAVSGATGEDFAKLTAQARQLGRDTQFTATQAAQSQENLARAGFKTDEVLSAMPGMLDMAAAESMDLSTAADIAASTLRGFNLSADQSGRVADVLAQASAASNTSISSLGEAMKYVAPVASGLGISLEETTAMLGAMANAGIKGSQGGTALRAALTRLSKEPAQVSKALSKMGVASRDAQGRMRKLPDLMKALDKQMKGWGDADRMQVLTQVFGTEAASGMLAIMNEASSGKLRAFEDGLMNAKGAAHSMAERMNDTAQGAMKRLGSAWESVQISVGNVLLPIVSRLADGLASVLSWVSALSEKYPELLNVVVGAVTVFSGLQVVRSVTHIIQRFGDVMSATAEAAAAARGLSQAAGEAAVQTGHLAKGMGGAVALASIGIPAALAVADQYMEAHKNKEDAEFEEAMSISRLQEVQAKLTAALMQRSKTGFEQYDTGSLDEQHVKILQFSMERKRNEFVDGLMPMVNSLNEQQHLNVKREDVMQWGATLAEAMNGSKDAINALPENLRFLAQTQVAQGVVATEAAPQPHALGGIFSTPHVGLVAEEGAEAVVPLTDRARGMPLWMAAGESMGVEFGSNTTQNNVTAGAPNFNITIYGGESDIAQRVKQAVQDALREIQDYSARVSFA